MFNLEFLKYFDIRIIRYSFYFKVIMISFFIGTSYHILKLEISTLIFHFFLIGFLYYKLIKADFLNSLKRAQVITRESRDIEELILNLKFFDKKLEGLHFVLPFFLGFFSMDAIIIFFKML